MIPDELNILLEKCKWEDAINYIDNLSIEHDDELSSKLAWSCSRAEKYDRAIEIYSKLIQKNPQFAKWYYARGYQFYMKSDWQAAIDDFSEALRIKPDYFKVKYRIAYALLKLSGNNQQWTKDTFWKAIKHIEDCHQIFENFDEVNQKNNSSTYADICFLHGKTIMASEKYIEKSILLLEKANELKCDNDFKYELAKAYYCNGCYEKALEVLPNTKKPYYIPELKAQILTALRRFDDSNNILFSIIKNRRKDYILRRISENFLYLTQYKKAEKYAKESIAINNKNYKNHLQYGYVLKEMKQYLKALEHFKKARILKQEKYNIDCVEAFKLIEEINDLTNNNPFDEPLAINNPNKKGIIEKYNNERGFGFIRDNESKESIFFHISDFTGSIARTGDLVSYSIEESPKGLKAIKISLA